MPKVVVYNTDGKEAGEMELSDTVFGVAPKKSVIHQVYVALQANAREPWADTKNKGEVRGGGKKPWKQKGTGRARHGSIRSPIWRGGGVTFGPLSTRNYKQKINKKMNQTAMRMSLSGKVKEGRFIILDSITSDGKTKGMAVLRKNMPGIGKTTLFVLPVSNEIVQRAARNIPRLDITQAANMNIVDVLHHQYILTTKEAIGVLEKRLG